MSQQNRMYLVDSEVLPEAFAKVLEVKRMLHSGEQLSTAEACAAAGVSRSAYYKYKDHIFDYNNDSMQIITVHAVLYDRAGILTRFVSMLYEAGANILTVNQNIPSGGKASVSVSFRATPLQIGLPELVSRLKGLDGVKAIERVSGE